MLILVRLLFVLTIYWRSACLENKLMYRKGQILTSDIILIECLPTAAYQ